MDYQHTTIHSLSLSFKHTQVKVFAQNQNQESSIAFSPLRARFYESYYNVDAGAAAAAFLVALRAALHAALCAGQ